MLFNHAVGCISSFSSGAERHEDVFVPSSDYGYYENIFVNADVQKNTTKTLRIREKLELGYRKNWFEMESFGAFSYNHSRADKRRKGNRDTWNYYYGLNANLDFDFGLSFSSDIRVNSRGGYPNANMNTDEWLWNAQVSYSFLKKKSAMVSLQLFDILKQQSNVSHAVSATHSSDSLNNDIHSYGMLHFIYKFRYIGGKKSMGKHKGGKHRRADKSRSVIDEVNEMSDEM